MIKYELLNWESLEFLKAHLWRRLTEPLNVMLLTFETAQQIDEKTSPTEKLTTSKQTAAAMLNTVNAWAALISYRQKGSPDGISFKLVNREQVPPWINAKLSQQTSLRLDFTRSIRINPETFWESLLLLHDVAAYISQVAYVQLADALPPKNGVYLRVIFTSKPDKEPFTSLEEIVEQFDTQNPLENSYAVQLLVARDMMFLNKAKFNLQNNKKTGQQAFSVYFEALDASTEPTDHDRETLPSAPPPSIHEQKVMTTPALPPVRESINPLSSGNSPTLPLKPTPATEDDSTIIEVAESAAAAEAAQPISASNGSDGKADRPDSDLTPTFGSSR